MPHKKRSHHWAKQPRFALSAAFDLSIGLHVFAHWGCLSSSCHIGLDGGLRWERWGFEGVFAAFYPDVSCGSGEVLVWAILLAGSTCWSQTLFLLEKTNWISWVNSKCDFGEVFKWYTKAERTSSNVMLFLLVFVNFCTRICRIIEENVVYSYGQN